mgnify:CR=1 FL=1|jgi:hypothetical protein
MDEKFVSNYLANSKNMEDVMNAYRNIRFELKKLGYTEESAKRVTNITPILGLNQTELQYYLRELKEEMSELFNLDEKMVLFYVQQVLNKIDSVIPLNDGN